MYAGGREERSSLPRWAAAAYYRAILQLQGWRFAYGDSDPPSMGSAPYYFTYCKDGVAAQVVMSQPSKAPNAERTNMLVTFSVPNCV
jgi:hypothetical protein